VLARPWSLRPQPPPPQPAPAPRPPSAAAGRGRGQARMSRPAPIGGQPSSTYGSHGPGAADNAGGLGDQVFTSAGHFAEYLDGLVDAATLSRQAFRLGVQRGP
jgi:hypothetical protein